MSAGNYGKAFAFATKERSIPATLCMPESAPVNRATLIEVRTCLLGGEGEGVVLPLLRVVISNTLFLKGLCSPFQLKKGSSFFWNIHLPTPLNSCLVPRRLPVFCLVQSVLGHSPK